MCSGEAPKIDHLPLGHTPYDVDFLLGEGVGVVSIAEEVVCQDSMTYAEG